MGPPWSGGPGAIAPVAPHPLNPALVVFDWKSDNIPQKAYCLSQSLVVEGIRECVASQWVGGRPPTG